MNTCREQNGAQTLLIDADDTLWENNIYFERAIAKFISFLDHREYSPEQVRLVLNDVERESHRQARLWTAQLYALAGGNFREACGRSGHAGVARNGFSRFAHHIADHPIEDSAACRRRCSIFASAIT